MTILDILSKAAGAPAAALVRLLEQVKEQSPDLAPAVDEALAFLNAGIAPENIVALATVLPAEIAAIAKGEFHPKSHPSDAA